MSRGVAGAESLSYVEAGVDVLLSDAAGPPFCAGKLFCDDPPNAAFSRIAFYGFLSNQTATYLVADPEDATTNAIVAASVETGERRIISQAVRWASLESSRPNWVYAFAQSDVRLYAAIRRPRKDAFGQR